MRLAAHSVVDYYKALSKPFCNVLSLSIISFRGIMIVTWYIILLIVVIMGIVNDMKFKVMR